VLNQLPPDLPVPVDDGATDHLPGIRLPSVPLRATDGTSVNLADLSDRTIVFIYPKTGRPGQPIPPEWDAIPGARGCTTQACNFRDLHQELITLGVAHVFGLSTQTTDYQREAVERLHLPFALLSDANLDFAQALHLPTFEFGGEILLRRLTLVIDEGTVRKHFYPVFPPDQSAAQVREWLSSQK
jgi:peroxiredoxin